VNNTRLRETSGRRRALVRAAAFAAAVATLVAGCSSSGKKSSSSTGTAGAGAGASASSSSSLPGTPIKIGVIGTLSGPQASSSIQIATVAPAWEKYVNANGGLNGHPVQVLVEDDGGDPAKAQAAEKKLVDSEKVVVLVVGSDNLVTAFDTDAISKGVAVLSGTANSADWYTKPGVFPTGTDIATGIAAQMIVAKQFGKAKKFANLYCSEVAACKSANAIQQPLGPKLGLGYTSLAVSSTATSYTAQCLELQQQNVDYAQLNFTTAAAAKFVQDCQAQNYNPTWGTSEQSIGPDYLKLKDFTALGPAYAFPSVADAAPIATFRDAMGKYAKDDQWKEGAASFTWDGLEVLHKALASVSASPTPADVLAALYTIKGDDLDGLLANKITFTKGKANPFGSQPCFFVVGVKDGKTVAPNGAKPVCAGA
jgi:branched-chain amino acid transport system substrate-binding protein